MAPRGQDDNAFWRAVVMRVHLYVMASAVLGAPYKADSLRWPICWKSFYAGELANIALDDRYVRRAEEHQRAKIQTLNDFYGQPLVLARVPLFLRTVLIKADIPRDHYSTRAGCP